jgi:hypothetical protein
MSSSFQLQAVIEFYGFDAESVCPWEIADIAGFAWIRLSAEMAQPEIGLFLAQLAAYNQIDLLDSRRSNLGKDFSGRWLGFGWWGSGCI